MPGTAYKRRIRQRKGELQGGRCFWCGGELLGGGTLDHLVPKSAGGSWWELNLVLSCRACNARRGSRTVREFLEGSGHVAVS